MYIGLYYLCPYRSTLQLALSDKRNCVFVLCSFELRVPNVCICCKVGVGLVPFLTFRARARRDAINDGRADVSCQLRVGVFLFEYILS